MTQVVVMIAGGGIGGLTLALTLDQIGVPFVLFGSVGVLKPLGVGINIQPNAVRELQDLGISTVELDQIGLPMQEWTLVQARGCHVSTVGRAGHVIEMCSDAGTGQCMTKSE